MSEVRFEPTLLSGTVDRVVVSWIKIGFWLNQNMILIKSKYDFD